MKLRNSLVWTVLGLSLALLFWFGKAQATTTITGPKRPLGDDNVHTYVVMGQGDRPTEIGVVVPEAALENLPEETTELNLPLPQRAVAKPPFTEVGLNWNPQGHSPDGIYTVPHMDFHFYTISQAERQQITATGPSDRSYVIPDIKAIPAGYVMAPDSAEPTQGSHWIDPTAPELQGTPHGFAHTFIYGFYNGQMDFLEPMVSQAFFKTHENFSAVTAQPQHYPKPGLYPGAYCITYQPSAHEYRIALVDLQPRD
jgi:hypothetical protein